MPRNQLVQSLQRGLVILDQIARSDTGLMLQELSQQVGLKPTTAHNLVRTLISQGFVEKMRRPVRYRLGPAVTELAGLRDRSLLHGEVPSVMANVFAELRDATVVLAQAVGGDIHKIARIIPERPGIVEYLRATSMHPYVSASALLFQSIWTEEERAAYQKRYPFCEMGAHAWGTEQQFARQMETTRRNGYAVVDLEQTRVFTTAAPITGGAGQVLAAFGATIPLKKASAARRRQVIERVLKAAADLSGQGGTAGG